MCTMRTLIVSICIFALAATHALARNDSYVNSRFGFAFDYPASWNKYENPPP